MIFFNFKYLNGQEYENLSRNILTYINTRNYSTALEITDTARRKIQENKILTEVENELNEFYVLDVHFQLLESVSDYWKFIENKEYYKSWCKLQDSLDAIRSIKKLGYGNSQTITFFETQLISLEKIYPYKIFSSMCFVVSYYECSLCGMDIDSDDCKHLKGELYFGEMALAVAKKIKNIDHVALVKEPLNKRLVVNPDDSNQIFKIFELLVESFSSTLRPLNFAYAIITESMKPNEKLVKQGRNFLCNCGSGKKYKKCCLHKSIIKHINVDFEQASSVWSEEIPSNWK